MGRAQVLLRGVPGRDAVKVRVACGKGAVAEVALAKECPPPLVIRRDRATPVARSRFFLWLELRPLEYGVENHGAAQVVGREASDFVARRRLDGAPRRDARALLLA